MAREAKSAALEHQLEHSARAHQWVSKRKDDEKAIADAAKRSFGSGAVEAARIAKQQNAAKQQERLASSLAHSAMTSDISDAAKASAYAEKRRRERLRREEAIELAREKKRAEREAAIEAARMSTIRSYGLMAMPGETRR